MFRFCLSPGGFIDLVYRETNGTSIPLAFWPKPISNLGLLVLTGFINSSLPLTLHPRLAPYRVLLSDIPSASRLRRVGCIVRRASDHCVTTAACLRSLQLKVQPVCLMFPYQTIIIATSCRKVSKTLVYGTQSTTTAISPGFLCSPYVHREEFA